MNALPDSIPARGAAASASRSPHIGQLVRQSFAAMTARERARLIAMYGVIAGLHVAGFVVLFVFVVPSHYNLAITGLSVAICFVIGAVEALSLLPQEIHGLSRTTGFWGLISRFNINTAGFVILGLFLATWLPPLLLYPSAPTQEK